MAVTIGVDHSTAPPTIAPRLSAVRLSMSGGCGEPPTSESSVIALPPRPVTGPPDNLVKTISQPAARTHLVDDFTRRGDEGRDVRKPGSTVDLVVTSVP
jgi:hypothetical protein